MHRIATTFALTALLLMMLAGPALAAMIACPPSPPPGSTLECGVSNADPEETLSWEASFADGTEESGELTTNDQGAGGLAVEIPDDPELAGTEFTIALETGASYTGMVGAPEDADAAAAAEDEADDAEVEAQDTEADENDEGFVDEDAEAEQVTERPDEDSEIALGAGGTAGAPGLALLVGALGAALILGGGTVVVRTVVRR